LAKALVDTTIIADALLKRGEAQRAAKQALASFEETLLPVYALKEFKAGALRNYVWFHNKLVLHGYADAIKALQRMSLTPRRYTTSTALEAIHAAIMSKQKLSLGDLVTKYGSAANHTEVIRDQWRLALKAIILQAWRRRRSVTTKTEEPLFCYFELDIREDASGLLDHKPTTCQNLGECEIAQRFRKDLNCIQELRDCVLQQDRKPENDRRSGALKRLLRSGKDPINDRDCRALGDAAFVLLCPKDWVILTTNRKDFESLAAAVGIKIEYPGSTDNK
jgi:predicted nucleic acid-binding protein